MTDTLTIQRELAAEREEDRFSRLRLIPWWDQKKIQAARVLVIGAGALGNEILKNLALLGFLHVVVVDLDHIETSNLSRSVMFRATDIGQSKADAIARGYKELLPEATVQPIVANVMQDCGLGLFAWADLILAGLDNREARLWINRSAWKVGRSWIDGAIEGINGVARVFVMSAPLVKPIGRSLIAACRAIYFCMKRTRGGVYPQHRPSLPSSAAFRFKRQSRHCMVYPLLSAKATCSRG